MGRPYITNNTGEWVIKGEFDLGASGAITASRGDGLIFTKAAGTGVYTVQVIEEFFVEVLHRDCDIYQATPTANVAKITGINLSSTGGATITITTLDDNATPAATNLTTGTVSFEVTFRKWTV